MAGRCEEQVAELVHRQEEEARMVGIKELVDSGLLHAVPAIYVRPPHERPDLGLAISAPAPALSIPVIDLSDLHDDNDGRSAVIQALGRACEEWGFFQIVNHGVEPAVIQRLRAAALTFFMQPAEERMRLHDQSFQASVRYFTSFNPSLEKVREWKDTLIVNRYPGVCDGFQEAPDICKQEVQEYIRNVEALAGRLYVAIFESLGLDKEYIEKEVPATPQVLMAINYYPPCPDPSLTLGLSSHSDVSCLTVLHPDDVPGLQIKHKGSWLPVFPVDRSAFVINLADQTEILTNGKYKSIEHRVVTNDDKPRMSIGCFFGPKQDTHVAPLCKLLSEKNPPLYKSTKFEDYFKKFYNDRLLAERGTLDFARI